MHKGKGVLFVAFRKGGGVELEEEEEVVRKAAFCRQKRVWVEVWAVDVSLFLAIGLADFSPPLFFRGSPPKRLG